MARRSLYVALAPLALAVASAGCAHEARQARPAGPMQGQPQEGTTAAASYAIPADNPQGAVNVFSFGARALPAPDGQTSPFLHVRVAAENRQDETAWTVDPNQQTLVIQGVAVAPTYAQAAPTSPVLTLARGQQGTMDLFYALPATGEPEEVVFSWRLQRANQALAHSTPLRRQPSQRQDVQAYDYRPYNTNLYVGVAPSWWWYMDTAWGWPGWYWGPGWWGGPWGMGLGWGWGPYWGWGWGGYYGRGLGRGVYSAPPASSGSWRGAPAGGGFRGGGGAPAGGGGGARGGGGGGSFRR
jgi:uncharacterized membrane protein YgcG